MPFRWPTCLARFVLRFWDAVRTRHASPGRYRFFPSDRLPSDVLHFCLVHTARLFFGLFPPRNRPPDCLYRRTAHCIFLAEWSHKPASSQACRLLASQREGSSFVAIPIDAGEGLSCQEGEEKKSEGEGRGSFLFCARCIKTMVRVEQKQLAQGKKENAAASTPPPKQKRKSLSPRARRLSIHDTPSAIKVWHELGSSFCRDMTSPDAGFEFSTVMNFSTIADNFELILKAMMREIAASFPDVLFPELKLAAKPPRRGKVVSKSPRRPEPVRHSTRGGGSGSRKPVERKPPPAECVYDFMGIARTQKEWYSKTMPLTEREQHRLDPLLQNIIRCTTTAERFGVFTLSWKMLSKERSKFGDERYSGHIMPLVIDTEPTKDRRRLSAMVIDINGVGLAPGRYNAIDPTQRPRGGPNQLLKQVLEVVLESIAARLGIAEWSVEFPTFENINLSEDDNETAREGDAAHPELAHARFAGMNDGICSIATLFVIMRLVCDQRRVLNASLDKTISRFIKDTSSYEHILFVRSFIYRLMAYFGLDSPAYGIAGDTVSLRA